MRRSIAVAAIGASFLVGLVASHGCVDDRARVKSTVFQCNPSSPTAATDCGAGFTCYSAAQSLGSSVCVPRCDPANAKSCNGACTQAGECLTRCTVPDPGQPSTCPAPLLCRRITDAPFERKLGPDGVCLPVNGTCSSSADCTSAIFDGCTSDVTGATQGPGLLTSGEVCVESRCFADKTACEPGSVCIKAILPAGVPVPDVCSPVCNSIRDRKSGLAFNECAPGLTCLADAFPQTRANTCGPGFPGWICIDQIGCAAGACNDWADVDPAMGKFLTCTPRCNTDDDCVPFDRATNPNLITHFTCQHTPDGDSWCRNLSSLFFPLTCLHAEDTCRLDPAAKCIFAPPAQIPDGGIPVCGGTLNNGAMGLGAFGGQAATCQRSCTTRDDCATMAANAHVPMSCQPNPNPNGPPKFCAPIIPFISPCDGDGDCMGGLHCLPIDKAGDKRCTLTCARSTECAANNALGSNFACAGGLCVPKVESGCKGGLSDFCLSGNAAGDGTCISPKGWACNLDTQCASGQCDLFPGSSPQFGRCR